MLIAQIRPHETTVACFHSANRILCFVFTVHYEKYFHIKQSSIINQQFKINVTYNTLSCTLLFFGHFNLSKNNKQTAVINETFFLLQSIVYKIECLTYVLSTFVLNILDLSMRGDWNGKLWRVLSSRQRQIGTMVNEPIVSLVPELISHPNNSKINGRQRGR